MSHIGNENRTRCRQDELCLNEEVTYHVDSRVFIVKPVFQSEGRETLGDVLLKLMKSEYGA